MKSHQFQEYSNFFSLVILFIIYLFIFFIFYLLGVLGFYGVSGRIGFLLISDKNCSCRFVGRNYSCGFVSTKRVMKMPSFWSLTISGVLLDDFAMNITLDGDISSNS